MVKYIKISNKELSTVDDKYYNELIKLNWYLSRRPHTYYAITRSNGKTILMHRLIMSWECGVSLEKISSMSSVDHIDRNGLNNQISNLRLVTQSENCQNREFPKKSNGYIGVNGCKNGYVAQVGLNGKKLYVGTFDNEIDAAEKRDIAVLKIYGNTAKLNFPTKRSEYQKMLDDGFDPLPRRDFVPYSKLPGAKAPWLSVALKGLP
ncbi:MAG: HNH endonuclease [Methanothrix sp.]|nr:HNH endonuclease [Methanothrix sp.]